MDGWELIALFDIQIMSSDVKNMSKRKQNQLLQLILKSRHKPINKMDLQREIRIALTEKKSNNLTTACKALSWNFSHVRPLSDMEFLMSAEHLF